MAGHSVNKTAFTLLELSLVLAVMSSLLIMTIGIFSQLNKVNNGKEVTEQMLLIEKALAEYLHDNKRLPCPAELDDAVTIADYAVASDGVIDCPTDATTATCPDITLDNNVYIGALPAKTLNLDENLLFDPWGRKITYAVDRRFVCSDATNAKVGGHFYDTIPLVTINDINGTAVTTKALYALVSYGENASGAYNKNGLQKSVSADSDEIENSDVDHIFVHHDLHKVDNAGSTQFDDIVRFQTKSQLVRTAKMSKEQIISFSNNAETENYSFNYNSYVADEGCLCSAGNYQTQLQEVGKLFCFE